MQILMQHSQHRSWKLQITKNNKLGLSIAAAISQNQDILLSINLFSMQWEPCIHNSVKTIERYCYCVRNNHRLLYIYKKRLHAGLHWWNPRASGRIQSSLKSGGLFLPVVWHGEYVAGVVPPLAAIPNGGRLHYVLLHFFCLDSHNISTTIGPLISLGLSQFYIELQVACIFL